MRSDCITMEKEITELETENAKLRNALVLVANKVFENSTNCCAPYPWRERCETFMVCAQCIAEWAINEAKAEGR